MLTRRLALRRETLAALSTEDMTFVGGNATGPTCATCLDCLPPSLRQPTACEQTAPTQYRTCTCN